MSDSESDIEIKSALLKIDRKKPPAPSSPTEDLKNKKITTKIMILDALLELKTRKGVSLYAIKKFLTEKYNVNTEKLNFIIKKTIKSGVEDGTIIQMKGIGASGSFKLATIKVPKPKKKKTEKAQTEKKTEKDKDIKKPKQKKTDDKIVAKPPKKMDIKKSENSEKPKKKLDKTEKKKEIKTAKKKEEKTEKQSKNEDENKVKKKKVKIDKGKSTPTKKRTMMMKRKSIGSIIKPPKMKPTSKA